jgi:hypothetical protein
VSGNLASVAWQIGMEVFDPGVTSYNGPTVLAFSNTPQVPVGLDICMMAFNVPALGALQPRNDRQGLLCIRRAVDGNNAPALLTGVSYTIGI